MFLLLERLDRGSGNSLSDLVGHNLEGNLTGLLVRRQRRVHFGPPNLQPGVVDFRGISAAETMELRLQR